MFKWLGIITAVLAVASAMGGALIASIVLGAVAVVSGVTHFALSDGSNTSSKALSPGDNPQSDRISSLSSINHTNNKQLNTDACNAMFLLAQSHQLGQNGKRKNLKEAFNCYIRTAKSGHQEALIPLERIGEEMSAEKQLELSQVYGTFFHNKEKADYWRAKATEIEDFKFNM